MPKKSKNMIRRRKYSRKHQRGGTLIVQEGYLENTHLCPKKVSLKEKKKETVGEEIYTYNGEIFQLNQNTLGYLRQMYKKTDDKWFKFVIFNNDGTPYIYIIQGGRINKHSVCMLIGLLEVTKNSGEYNDLRNAVKELISFKLNIEPNMIENDETLKQQLVQLIERVDELVNTYFKCMPVIAAGSGSINEDNSICINDKSGHYKPTTETMNTAKNIFMMVTGLNEEEVRVTTKPDKELLEAKYGREAENYSGICL